NGIGPFGRDELGAPSGGEPELSEDNGGSDGWLEYRHERLRESGGRVRGSLARLLVVGGSMLGWGPCLMRSGRGGMSGGPSRRCEGWREARRGVSLRHSGRVTK